MNGIYDTGAVPSPEHAEVSSLSAELMVEGSQFDVCAQETALLMNDDDWHRQVTFVPLELRRKTYGLLPQYKVWHLPTAR